MDKTNEELRELVAAQTRTIEEMQSRMGALINEKADAEAMLIVQSMDPEDALNDCMVGNGPCPATGEYDTHWDEAKLRAKFMVGDNTVNMESRAELAYYEYTEARMMLEWEAMQRREKAAPNFEAWFTAAAQEYKAYDRDYSRKVWVAAVAAQQPSPPAERTAIPEGWRVVPIIPTPEMMQAAWNKANFLHGTPEADDPLPGHQYRAMVAAAPSPQADQQGTESDKS